MGMFFYLVYFGYIGKYYCCSYCNLVMMDFFIKIVVKFDNLLFF